MPTYKPPEQPRKPYSLMIFDLLEGLNRTPGFEEINLEVRLHLLPPGRNQVALLELRIGQQRMYIVKDMMALLQSIITGRPLVFGKQFTLEPLRHRFKPADQSIIDLLLEMSDHYRSLGEIHFNGSYFNYSYFSQKALPLTEFYLKRLLELLVNKSFQLTVANGPELPDRLVQPALPLAFVVQSQEQDLALSLMTKEIPLPVTSDAKYLYYQQQIYQTTPEQHLYLQPFLEVLRKGGANRIVFATAQKERFVSEVLPLVQKIGQVQIEPDLADKFCQEELTAKLYFDRAAEQGIAARVEFHYGGLQINPFSAETETRNKPEQAEVILVRDAAKERRILDLLEQADFIVKQGEIQLIEEKKIYAFIMNFLPPLQELAEVYYSTDFKGFQLRTATSFASRVRLDENLNMLEISFDYSDIAQNELAEVLQSIQIKKRYHRLRDGSFLNLNQPELQYVAELMDNLALNPEDFQDNLLYLPQSRAMYLDNFLRQNQLPGIQRNKAFKQLVQSILEPQDNEYEVPASLEQILRDYQKTGFKWLKTLASYGLGGILADDMGLGKTLQVLTFILSEKVNQPKPSLVIAPTSLVYNWQEEAAKFAPELEVVVIAGPPNERLSQLNNLAGCDLVVTSYPLIRRDIEAYTNLEFAYCFLDEAQYIKNPQTINAQVVQQLKAKSYFALTGTPIENSLIELWSIFNFVLPGYLLAYPDFRLKYELPIVKGENPRPLTELSRQVKPFILRRLKKDVLKELPEKIETQLKARMTEQQKKLYLAYLQEAKGEIAKEIASVGFDRSRIKILAALTRLRQICCHPSMFLENYSGESGKMLLFKEVLSEALESGHRLLVFSQFTSMLEIIREYLSVEKISYFYLQGSTSMADRARMVHNFNQGEGQVFLISLKAGGTGLNLVGADMVIHYDPWWNPAVEEQATDRAHRIGQKQVVQVIKLITQGTVEENVAALQQKKKALIEAVIQPGENLISKMTETELRELFDLN